MALKDNAIVSASALPRTGTWRVQSPDAMSRAAAAMSISGLLVRRLKIKPPARAITNAAGAGQQERSGQLVDELLRGCPVLQKHQLAHLIRRAIRKQREGAFDESPRPDLPALRGNALWREARLRAASHRGCQVPPFVRGEAAAHHFSAGHQIDLRTGPLRQLLRHVVTEDEPERERTQHFAIREFGGLGRDQEQLARNPHDVAARLAGGGAFDGGGQAGRQDGFTRPARVGDRRALRIRENTEVGAEIAPVTIRRFGERGHIAGNHRVDHAGTEERKRDDEPGLGGGEVRAVSHQPIERRPRVLKVDRRPLE
jgi:hypothetical protein